MSKKILVVDDEPMIVRLIESTLKESGYEVMVATGGDEALNSVYAERPDLIVLDIRMPGRDGLQLSQKLKTDDKYKDVPTILLSGLIKQDMPAEGLQEGDLYMAKPFQPKRFLSAVKELLQGKRPRLGEYDSNSIEWMD